jgi:hypothetical protein
MRKPTFSILLSLLFLALSALADTIILHDGTSYSGQFVGATSGEITFTDAQGIQYRFRSPTYSRLSSPPLATR